LLRSTAALSEETDGQEDRREQISVHGRGLEIGEGEYLKRESDFIAAVGYRSAEMDFIIVADGRGGPLIIADQTARAFVVFPRPVRGGRRPSATTDKIPT